MLLDGCVDQRVEACEAEVEHVHEAGEVSRSTDSRTTSLYRRSVLSPAPAGSSTCLQDGFKRLEKEGCKVTRVFTVQAGGARVGQFAPRGFDSDSLHRRLGSLQPVPSKASQSTCQQRLLFVEGLHGNIPQPPLTPPEPSG